MFANYDETMVKSTCEVLPAPIRVLSLKIVCVVPFLQWLTVGVWRHLTTALLILVKGPPLVPLLSTAVMKSLSWTEIPPVCVFQVEFGQRSPLPAIVSAVPLVYGSIICWHICV